MSDVIWLPDDLIKVTESSFRLVPGSLFSTALFTGEVSPYGPVVARFRADLEFAPMVEERWREWEGLIADFEGLSGRIRTYDPVRREPYYNQIVTTTTENWDDDTTWDDGTGWESGKLPSSVALDAAANRGDKDIQLAFPSGFESLSAVLRRGDLLEIRPNGVPVNHGHLYVVRRTANTDASGKTGVQIAPGLRTAAAAGDQVVLEDATTVFRLESDEEGAIQVDTALHGRLGLSLVEVLPRS